MTTAPSPSELDAYRRGALDPQRFAQVDSWIAALPDAEQERLLRGDDAQAGGLAEVAGPATASSFVPASAEDRFQLDRVLGVGGLGVVTLLHDRTLGRDVAVKRLRPRYPDEMFEAYVARLHAFRREAAITARLEHPAIVPVHDLGQIADAPAFTMKLLEGDSLAQHLAREDRRPLAHLVQVLLRVAEAIGYAHAHGVVHRDLKPENVIIGRFGAVYVIDWGLAAETSGAGDRETACVGSHLWMAPEQAQAAPPDPRMDVFALGGLLLAVLVGRGPRESQQAAIDLTPLSARSLPRGLVALARRCLADDPADRYPDGAAVADDLRRWLSAGLTDAQRASVWLRSWSRLRRSPRLSTGVIIVVTTLLLAGGWETWHRHFHRAERLHRIEEIERVPLADAAAVRAALDQVRLELAEDPGLASARLLESRLVAAIETQRRQAEAKLRDERLRDLAAAYRVRGPWPTDELDWRQALHDSGLVLSTNAMAEDAERIGHDPSRQWLLTGLVRLWHAEAREGAGRRDPVLAALVQEVDASDGWHAVGRLMEEATFQAHDCAFPAGPVLESALSDPASADALLAVSASDDRLVRYARTRLAEHPGDFWPLITIARASIVAGDAAAGARAALIALGAEPNSLWPRLALAYAALERGDAQDLVDQVDAGLAANPRHAELLVLRAVTLARNGRVQEAQAIIDGLDAAHLQFHLHRRSGHPMERSVAAAVAAGLTIPAAPPEIGPLVPRP